jgi:flavin-dependent dehydrogenase
MKSGMLAAESAFEAIEASTALPISLDSYQEKLEKSWVWKELTEYDLPLISPEFEIFVHPSTALLVY